jgi:hypothetical protein
MTTDQQKKENRHPGIRRMTTKTGEVKYRLIIDMGERPDGKRDQRCETFNRLTDAKARQAEIKNGRKKGTLVRPSKITVAQAIDGWLAGRRNLRPSTRRSYRDSLELAKTRIGRIQLQNLTKAHLDHLVTELQEHGRRVGNVQRQGLSGRSVNLMLTVLGSVLEDQVKQGTLSRNVAKLVERPEHRKKDIGTWTERQAAAFLEAVSTDRLSAAFHLSLYGLRRGRFSDCAGTTSTWTPRP